MAKTVVIAIGGNSLISDNGHQSVSDQYDAAAQTCEQRLDVLMAAESQFQ